MCKQDLVGQTFGRWTVIERGTPKRSHQYWHCQCACGVHRQVENYQLRTGKSLSCGCRSTERINALNRKHGEAGSRLHIIWQGMWKRCQNPRTHNYHRYGGRGITVYAEWREYSVFAEWARANGYTDSLTIERIDVNKNYCPENCTWTSTAEQSRNRRDNIKIVVGETQMCLAEAARVHGVPYGTVYSRRAKGWPESRWFEPLRAPQ